MASIVISLAQPIFAIDIGIDLGGETPPLHCVSPIPLQATDLELNSNFSAPLDLNASSLGMAHLPELMPTQLNVLNMNLKKNEFQIKDKRFQTLTPKKFGMSAKNARGIAQAIQVLKRKLLPENGNDQANIAQAESRFFDFSKAKRKNTVEASVDSPFKRLKKIRGDIRHGNRSVKEEAINRLPQIAKDAGRPYFTEIAEIFQTLFKDKYWYLRLNTLAALEKIDQIPGLFTLSEMSDICRLMLNNSQVPAAYKQRMDAILDARIQQNLDEMAQKNVPTKSSLDEEWESFAGRIQSRNPFIRLPALDSFPQIVKTLGPAYYPKIVELLSERIARLDYWDRREIVDVLPKLKMIGAHNHQDLLRLFKLVLQYDSINVSPSLQETLIQSADFADFFESLSIQEIEEFGQKVHSHSLANLLDSIIEKKRLTQKKFEEILAQGKAELPDSEDGLPASKRYGGILDP